MKPFNLEEARKGHPIQTRNGRAAQFITYLPSGEYQVLVMVENKSRFATVVGRMNTDGTDHEHDLFMVDRDRKVWVNVYKAPHAPAGVALSLPFVEESHALENAQRGTAVLATVPLEFTE